MYRIEFDPNTGRFIIQVLRFGVVWVTVKDWSFTTYDAACERIIEIGLHKLYADKSADKFRSHMTLQSAAGARGFKRMRNSNGEVVWERDGVIRSVPTSDAV